MITFLSELQFGCVFTQTIWFIINYSQFYSDVITSMKQLDVRDLIRDAFSTADIIDCHRLP